MRLNADIIYHSLKKQTDVSVFGICENGLSLYRPEFYLDRSSAFLKNHVYVCSADHLSDEPEIEDNVLLICLGDAPQRKRFEERCGILSVPGEENIFRVFNIVQDIFNKYEAWDAELNEILRRGASLQELLNSARDIFENPMLLIGADFNYLAYTEEDYLRDRLGIRLDGPNFDPDLLEVFLSLHDVATDIREPLLLNLMGRSTLSVNIFDVDEYLGCITVFGEFREFRSSDIELCQLFAERIRQAFLMKPDLAGERASLRGAILNIIRGQPVDREQREVIRRTAGQGERIFLALRPESDASQLPRGYVSSLIEQQFRDSLAFEYGGGIAAVLPAGQEERERLLPFLQKIRMKCGVSHRFSDLYDSAYACDQALSALDEGCLADPGESLYCFEDYILPLLLKNAVKNIPSRFFYPYGLSRLAEHDAASPVSYVGTLKAFLDSNMSVAETARKLNLHRSSLIDRLGRITQLLDCDLDDPAARLALQIVLFAENKEKGP